METNQGCDAVETALTRMGLVNRWGGVAVVCGVAGLISFLLAMDWPDEAQQEWLRYAAAHLVAWVVISVVMIVACSIADIYEKIAGGGRWYTLTVFFFWVFGACLSWPVVDEGVKVMLKYAGWSCIVPGMVAMLMGIRGNARSHPE